MPPPMTRSQRDAMRILGEQYPNHVQVRGRENGDRSIATLTAYNLKDRGYIELRLGRLAELTAEGLEAYHLGAIR